MNIRLRPTLALAALVAGLAALSLNAATAQAPVGSSQPLKVGIVDLGKLGDGLKEAADANDRLKAQHTAAQGRLDEVVNLLKQKQQDMENMRDKNSQAYLNLWSDAAELNVQARARKEALEKVFDQQKGIVTADMYVKMIDAIGELARQEGYDLIMVDDRGLTPPSDRGADAVGQVIQARKVLFASPRLDITQQVITFMNNRYTPSSTRPPAPPPAIPPAPGATGSAGPTIAPGPGATAATGAGRNPR